MAKSARASPPTSVSMWPASARSARLPVKSAPSTSTTRNAAVSPSVVRSRPRERAAAVGLPRISLVGLSMGGRVAIAFAGTHPRRVERLVIVDIGPEIAAAGRLRVGSLMAQTPERFDDLEAALAWVRATNPRYTDAMLRHRIAHGTRPSQGGLV